MLRRIVSGGQAGADQAGWRAARALGIETGGWMPAGFATEDGPRPGFAAEFGAAEVGGKGRLEDRTRANARDSDATAWFGDPNSSGARTTLKACRALGRPTFLASVDTPPRDLAEWAEANGVEVLNVAGNRESVNPGIGDRVERFLVDAFGPKVR